MNASKITLDVQYVSDQDELPSLELLTTWASAAIDEKYNGYELVVRIVDEEESAMLNERYRQKKGATNVLSFVADIPPGVELSLLGDLVICAPVVYREAQQQAKDRLSHWAHMVIHGSLHLQGYDHQQDEEAACMESFEKSIMQDLGFADPYQ